MNAEIRCIFNQDKTAKYDWRNDNSNFLRALYCVYKKISTILFPYYSFTFLNEDASVLLKVIIIIWTR